MLARSALASVLASALSGIALVAITAAPHAQGAAASAVDYTSLGTSEAAPLVLVVSPEGLVAVRGEERTPYAVEVALATPQSDSLADALGAIAGAAQERARLAADAIELAKADAAPQEWESAEVVVQGEPTTPEQRAAMGALAAALESEFGSDRVAYDVALIRLPGTLLFQDTLPPGEEVPAPRFWDGLFDRLR